MSDFFDQAKERAEADASGEQHPTWKFKENPEFMGTLVDAKVQTTKDGRVNFLLTVQQHESDDLFAMWVGDSPFMLKEQMLTASPAKGTLIFAAYLGKKPTKDGTREYGVYSFQAEESDFEWWNKLGAEKYRAEQGDASYDSGAGTRVQATGVANIPPDESPF